MATGRSRLPCLDAISTCDVEVKVDAAVKRLVKTAPRFIPFATPVLVNGAVGALFGTRDDPISVLGVTIVGGRIAALDLVATPAKLRHLWGSALGFD